jgi:hemerythrin
MAEPKVDSDFLKKIKQEHAELGRLVSELRAALADQGNVAALSALLERLKAELVEHFAIEEAGGYFNEVLTEAPRLKANADLLLGQHEELMQKLKSLCNAAKHAAVSEEKWAQLVANANGFIASLIEHERGENYLLQEAYERDIGPED